MEPSGFLNLPVGSSAAYRVERCRAKHGTVVCDAREDPAVRDVHEVEVKYLIAELFEYLTTGTCFVALRRIEEATRQVPAGSIGGPHQQDLVTFLEKNDHSTHGGALKQPMREVD